MARSLVIRPAAEADLDALFDYIARDSPRNAVEFIRRIRTKCNDLTMFPERGRLREDLGAQFRIFGFERRAVVVYRVLETEVEVLRILYGGRELERLFAKE